MPRPRKALRTIRIDPKPIREARDLIRFCNEEGSQADALTLLLADAIPSKPCDNLNCRGWHLPEDCQFPVVCTFCGKNDHTACHCRTDCARCGAAGHHAMSCVSDKDIKKGRLSPVVQPPQRLAQRPVVPPCSRPGRVWR